MKYLLFIVTAMFTMSSSCSKKDSTPSDTAPSNLALTAVVSTDNSGNVAFTATATNAVSYDYDFGNGIFQTVANGVVTYKYPASGTYTVNVVAKSAGGKTSTVTKQITVSVALALVWAEEFSAGGAPDPSKWGYDTGAGGWGNNELQYYTNRLDNASVSNGTLKIVAQKEAYSGSAYTSGRILTKDKFSFKYGKIEVSAKLPAGGGSWPAIWMLGNNIGTVSWPACGEIDIMEHVGNQLNKIFATLHHPGHSGGSGDGSSVMNPTATTAFHKYSLEWNAATLKFAVDDVTFYTFANNATLPFNQNFFIILNVAIGGNFGGAVDPALTNATMEVDYVRVYQ